MPRGDNPNSRKNLIKNSDLTPEERREKASMMGKKSGEVRRALKSFAELDLEQTTDEERLEMLKALKARAKKSDSAFALYRDTVGLKPVDKVEQSNMNYEIDFGNLEGDE